MEPIAFDTLEFVETMSKAGMDADTAKALARANRNAFAQMLEQRELATKGDLRETELRIQKQIADTAAASERHLTNLMLVITTAIIAAVGIGVGYIVSRLPV